MMIMNKEEEIKVHALLNYTNILIRLVSEEESYTAKEAHNFSILNAKREIEKILFV